MKIKKTEHAGCRGFLGLAEALLIAAIALVPFGMALVLDMANTLPDIEDYPPSLYSL